MYGLHGYMLLLACGVSSYRHAPLLYTCAYSQGLWTTEYKLPSTNYRVQTT